MKKISLYLTLSIVLGLSLISFWVYQRYFKTSQESILHFSVERGDVEEVVKVRGEVVAEKNFDLEFPFSGTVERIFVAEGDEVRPGSSLIALETTDFLLEKQRLEATRVERESGLQKLVAGATPEELRVADTRVKNAQVALGEARKVLTDKIWEAYAKSDDGIRNKIDQFFNNPRTDNPQLRFASTDTQLEWQVEFGRFSIEKSLTAWNMLLSVLASSNALEKDIEDVGKYLEQTKVFLDTTAFLVNSLTTTSGASQADIDTWKAAVANARANVDTVSASFFSAREKFRVAETNLRLAEDELALKKAPTRTEDIEIARAQIRGVESQIAALSEKIRKSTLIAPVASKITKIWLEKGEVFTLGSPAVSVSTLVHKITTDISELDIRKIREGNGNEVQVWFDAFPGEDFIGKVVSVDQKEIIKDGDKYYKVNIALDLSSEVAIRSGMSADLIIRVSSLKNVLKIPELAVYRKEGKLFVKIEKGGELKEVEVQTGVSDGKYVQILAGLEEGQSVVVLHQ